MTQTPAQPVASELGEQPSTPSTSFESSFNTLLRLLKRSDFRLQETLDHLAYMKATIADVGDLINARSTPFFPFSAPRTLGLIAYLVAQYENRHCTNPLQNLFKDKEDQERPSHLPYFTRTDLYTLIPAVIEMGVDINAKGSSGLFAHLLPVYSGDHDLLSFLIDLGADVNQSDFYGHTCLERAARYGQVEMARTLIHAGADVNLQEGRPGCESPIFSALLGQSMPMLELLHTHGANLNLQGLNKGETPLIYAATLRMPGNADAAALGDAKKLEMMHWLLEHGADVNALDQKGFSALHRVAHAGQVEPLKCLIEHGAALNMASPEGYTALHFAAMSSRFSDVSDTMALFELLITQGGRLDLVSHKGQTPLEIAKQSAYFGNEAIDYLQTCDSIQKERALLKQLLEPEEMPSSASQNPITDIQNSISPSNLPLETSRSRKTL